MSYDHWKTTEPEEQGELPTKGAIRKECNRRHAALALIAKAEGRKEPRCDCGGSPHGKGCSLVLNGVEPYVRTHETSSQTWQAEGKQ